MISITILVILIMVVQVKVRGKLNALGYFCIAACFGAVIALLLQKLL